MNKEQLNQLASKYGNMVTGKNKAFVVIHAAVKPMENHIKRKFNSNYIAYIDYDSIAADALLKSLYSYDISKGHFSNHYMRRLSSEVTREAIKNQPGIRLPEELAKKDFQISQDARSLMISGLAKQELMDLYELTESQYIRLVHFYTEVPRFLDTRLEDLKDTNESKDFSIDINNILNHVPVEYRKPIIMYFGLLGSTPHTAAQIKSYYKIDMKKVLKHLQENEKIKELLGGYDE